MNGNDARDRLIVALDMDADAAIGLAHRLEDHVRWLKVGMTLFYEAGPEIVVRLRDLGFEVFLDLKLHDIPHQVRGAAATVSRLGAGLLTVHASGGADMVRAAVEGAEAGAAEAGVERPAVLAVTVLTSMSDDALQTIGVARSSALQVPALATISVQAGADGVVCAPTEAHSVRSVVGEAAWVVTPGVRPDGSDRGDQTRVATPASAISAGASHLVIGRPITGAPDPVHAVETIIRQIEEAGA